MFKHISIAQLIYLIINLLIFEYLFIEYPNIICYLLYIDRYFTMPKAFRRFLKKLPKKIQSLKYSFREFLSSKI